MKALVAALERIATALEQLVPALTQATRDQRQSEARKPKLRQCGCVAYPEENQ